MVNYEPVEEENRLSEIESNCLKEITWGMSTEYLILSKASARGANGRTIPFLF